MSDQFTYVGKQPVPDFPPGLEWFNVDRPLSLTQDLRGKIVLLDFWTLGCINCIHIIPDLKRLETEYADSLVVIGVHSAKFETEGLSESIRQAILRYDLEHPVVNDRDFQIWHTFGVRAWPTLVLIDPYGKAVGFHAGEGIYEVFQPIIDVMDNEYREAGIIDTRSLRLVLENTVAAPSVLSFPGKVLADEAGSRLFIADSNHHRVLVATLEGELTDVIGSGMPGLEDGDFASAQFQRPQGMALSHDGNILYVADLENHAVRAADLSTRQVTTIAGTGEQSRFFAMGKPGTETALSSPWDLVLVGDRLYIAMSGLHQIWIYDLTEDRVAVFAGNGREGIDDGPPPDATLAQPSGLTTDGETLYLVDPESSAVRAVPLDGTEELRTIIGAGLFDFGDVDGQYPEARLQHALGIAYYDGMLYVADTYNQKIKVVDPLAQTVQNWIGTGEIGWQDGDPVEAEFAEPSGLSIANGKLYIADTNNHLIRAADLESGEVSTLTLTNLGIAAGTQSPESEEEVISFGLQAVQHGPGTLEFVLSLPEGYKFNDYGPFTLSWQAEDSSVVKGRGGGPPVYEQFGPEFPIRFPVTLRSGETIIHVEATVYYCEVEQEEFCLVADIGMEIPVIVSEDSVDQTILVEYELPGLQNDTIR